MKRCLPALVAVGVIVVVWRISLMSAVETCQITLPASVSFAVTNVSVSTLGNPHPTAVSYSNGVVNNGHVIRISVKADSNFVPPSGTAIPASKVSWTTSNAVRGTGSNGALSTSAYTQVFQASPNRTSGSVDVTWTLAAPGTPLRAGTHSMTMRWKIEAF